MGSRILTKENISWATGISVVIESENDYQQRVDDVRGYYQRRFDMATEAVGDPAIKRMEGPARESAWGLLSMTRMDFEDFNQKSVKRKRWLDISGYKIPIPSRG